MITIGLTGGIASGKSTVSAELRSLGLPVFDADAEARLAVAAGSEGLAQVIAVLGKEYLSEEGTLDRAKVAERIFHDKEALKAVEAIIHKIVWQQAESFLAASSKQGHSQHRHQSDSQQFFEQFHRFLLAAACNKSAGAAAGRIL